MGLTNEKWVFKIDMMQILKSLARLLSRKRRMESAVGLELKELGKLKQSLIIMRLVR